jgi:hypothetical protein
MKLALIAVSFALTGCAATTGQYSQYLEQTTKLAASQNAAEAACLLVIAEGIKTADPSNKALLISQIDKCRKEPVRAEPPKKNWLGW